MGDKCNKHPQCPLPPSLTLFTFFFNKEVRTISLVSNCINIIIKCLYRLGVLLWYACGHKLLGADAPVFIPRKYGLTDFLVIILKFLRLRRDAQNNNHEKSFAFNSFVSPKWSKPGITKLDLNMIFNYHLWQIVCTTMLHLYDFLIWLGTSSNPADINRFQIHTVTKTYFLGNLVTLTSSQQSPCNEANLFLYQKHF